MAGVIGYGFKYRGVITDANSATEAGIYKVDRNGSNVPSEVASVANYITVEPTDVGYFQTLRPYDNSKNSAYYRHIYGSTFGEWQRLDNFGYNTLADLATGVTGLINPLMIKEPLSGTDLDSLFTFGLYTYGTGGAINAGYTEAGLIIVVGYSSTRIVQIQITFQGKICARFYSGTWTNWMSNGVDL